MQSPPPNLLLLALLFVESRVSATVTVTHPVFALDRRKSCSKSCQTFTKLFVASRGMNAARLQLVSCDVRPSSASSPVRNNSNFTPPQFPTTRFLILLSIGTTKIVENSIKRSVAVQSLVEAVSVAALKNVRRPGRVFPFSNRYKTHSPMF